jgi:hypothetical protein
MYSERIDTAGAASEQNADATLGPKKTRPEQSRTIQTPIMHDTAKYPMECYKLMAWIEA